MIDEISYFRKRFLGGFNREDVIGHITKLSQERNILREAKEAADEETRAIAAEIEPLRREIAEVRKAGKLALEDKDKDLLAMAEEIASLRLEIDESNRVGGEHREAKEMAEQVIKSLGELNETLRGELQSATREAEEGRVYHAELLDSRARAALLESELEVASREAEEGRRHKAESEARGASLEAVKNSLADIGLAFDSLRSSF